MMKGMNMPPGAAPGANPFGAPGASPFGAAGGGAPNFGPYGAANPFAPNFKPPVTDTTATAVDGSAGQRGEKFAQRAATPPAGEGEKRADAPRAAGNGMPGESCWAGRVAGARGLLQGGGALLRHVSLVVALRLDEAVALTSHLSCSPCAHHYPKTSDRGSRG